MIKSIKHVSPSCLIHLISLPNTRMISSLSRTISTKTHHSYSFPLPSDHSKIVDRLISIFTRPPFDPQTQELRDFGSKLTTDIVETVLRGFKNWKIAHMFFTWSSNQSGYAHNCYTYNAMASILSSARQNAPLRVLAMDMVKSGCSLTPGALGFFIRCLGDQGLVKEANLLFDQVRKMGLCVPNNYSYNCLLEAISKSSAIDLIDIRLKEMQDLGWMGDKYTLTPVLQCYCNAGKFEEALNVFNQLHGRGWVDTHVLSILVLSFTKWGEVDKAFELIERMEDINVRLNEKTFCVLIHGFVRESRVDKALQLFDKMRKSGYSVDISLYDVLIGGLCKNEKLDKALQMYSEMQKLGISPDVGILTKLISSLPGESEMIQLIEERAEDLDNETLTLLYNSVLNSLVNNGSVDKAYHLLRAMMQDGSDGDFEDNLLMVKEFVRPDTTSFSIVISALCQTEKLDLALGLFQVMGRIGCKRSVLLYNNLIDALSKLDRVQECFELMREMESSGFKSTHFTYNSIFGCLCRREDVEGAVGMVREMRGNGHKPWIKHCTTLVKKLCGHGRAVEACNFLASMVREGFLPDIVSYSTVIDGFLNIQEVDRALELFRDICARGYFPDIVAYNIIINGLSKAKRVSEAHDVLNEMLEKGLVPSVVTYNSLIDGWCKSGDIDRAVLCLSRMDTEKREPNVITYTTLMDGLCNAGRPNEALKLWNEMVGKGCSPNRISFMALINGLCKCGLPDEALVYFLEMEEKEMGPDIFLYVALIDAFLSNSKPLLAFNILTKMVNNGSFPDSTDKNHLIMRDAVFKMSEDMRTSLEIKNLIAEGSIPAILSSSCIGSENGFEPIA